jgi:hypothetical protein
MRSFNGTLFHILSDMEKIQSGITLAKKFLATELCFVPKAEAAAFGRNDEPPASPSPCLTARPGRAEKPKDSFQHLVVNSPQAARPTPYKNFCLQI